VDDARAQLDELNFSAATRGIEQRLSFAFAVLYSIF